MKRCTGILLALLMFTLGISEYVPETETFMQIMKPKWQYYIYSEGYPKYFHGEQRRKFEAKIPANALRAEKRGEINVSCSVDFPDYKSCPTDNISSITINVFKEPYNYTILQNYIHTDILFTTYMCGEMEASYNTERIDIDWNVTKTRGRFSCTLIADYKPDPKVEYAVDHNNIYRFKVRPPPPSGCECGKENFPKKNHIGLFGYEAGMNQYPFMAALVQYKGAKSKFWCGASIISRSYALSSAQCKYDNDKDEGVLRLRVGDHNNKIECETNQTAMYEIEWMKQHESWSYGTRHINDIMLIKTQVFIIYKYGVGAVCLPISGDSLDAHEVKFLGWGSNSDNQYPDVLKEIRRNQTTDCNLSGDKKIKDRWLCTHENTLKDGTCTTDTGGPLIGKDSNANRNVLIGILTLQSCNNAKVDVFTRVVRYFDWIRNTTSKGTVFC